VYVLDTCLRLLHPYMPFITEELWQRLPHHGEALVIAQWPQMGKEPLVRDLPAEAQYASLQALVRAVRNVRAEYRVEPNKKVGATVTAMASLAAALEVERDAIAVLARVDPNELQIVHDSRDAGAAAEPDGSVKLVVEEGLEAYVPLADLIDPVKERKRLGKQESSLEASISKLAARLSSPGFTDKAPAEVVAKAEGELRDYQQQLEAVQRSLAALPC